MRSLKCLTTWNGKSVLINQKKNREKRDGDREHAERSRDYCE